MRASDTDDAAVDRAAAAFAARPRPVRLRPAVQHYDWGGHEFIPALLGSPNTERRPHAELWIGSHPLAPASVDVGGSWVRLDHLLARSPDAIVGREVSGQYGGGLPYLLKVVDVRTTLSIQAHPNLEQARQGFAREEALRLPRDGRERSYRDANHKPEASVALGDFWLLHGFKPVGALVGGLGEVPELRPLLTERLLDAATPGTPEADRRAAVRELFARVMTTTQQEVDDLLGPLAERLMALDRTGQLDRARPEFWAARALRQLAPAGAPYDRGVISIFLLNLVRLGRGQGVFIPAGVPHAYLEGVAVEAMASSDNVIRGGLTRKHVDAAELLRILTFASEAPAVIDGARVSDVEQFYPTPAAEFVLSWIDLDSAGAFDAGPVHGADALLVLDGDVVIEACGGVLALPRGGAALVPTRLTYRVRSAGGRATVLRASVPLHT